MSILGASKYPKHENKKCYGVDLNRVAQKEFTLKYVFNFYKEYMRKQKQGFFISESFFNKLIGNSYVLEHLKKGTSYLEVEKLWESEVKEYKMMRKRYLKYE